MRLAGAVLWLVCASCIEADLVPCGNGLTCPTGRTCVLLTDPDETVCASATDLAACRGLDDHTLCTRGAFEGVCLGGACVPVECGNWRIDPGEMCDDGNAVTGDGSCSADCLSDETCGNGVVDPLQIIDDVRLPAEECDDGNLVSSDGCSSTCRLESPRWIQIDSKIVPSFCGAATTDLARNRVVVFGGSVPVDTETVPTDSTYEWNGKGWSRAVSLIDPQVRQAHAMAYDARRHRVVMFGGNIGDLDYALGDTWEWDGTVWAQRATSGPSARSGHTLAYDGVRKRVVMFGGYGNGTYYNDLWEWDGTAWAEIQTTNPPGARRAHVMGYDPVRGVLVLAGGLVGDLTGNEVGWLDTWELSGTVWTKHLATTTPVELSYSAMFGYDTAGARFIAYRSSKTYAYGLAGWVDLGQAQPGMLSCAQIAVDPTTNHLLMTGGSVGLSMNQRTYRWTGSGWAEPPPSYTPPPRIFAAAAHDTLRGVGWVFGGNNAAGDETNILASFDGTQWTQVTATGPTARSAPAMAFDRARGELVVFGGILDGGATSNETWTFDGATWTLRAPVHVPSARVAAELAYDSGRQRVVLFGGAEPGPVFKQDTWEWDGTDWTEISTSHIPPGRMEPGFVYDEARGVVVLQQGFVFNAPQQPTDVWTYDGTDWTLVATTTPLATRLYSTATYDPARRRVIAFGGASIGGAAFRDTWSFDGMSYTQLLIQDSPTARGAAVSFSSPEGHGIIVHGGTATIGTSTAQFDDTWLMRYDNDEARELCAIESDNDADGLSGCADPDCWAVCTPSCPPGAPCDPAAPQCGDGRCGAIENCRVCAMDCTCPAVCGDSFCDGAENPVGCPGDCTP